MYRVWDLETTITSSFKRKGNPFDPANFIVASGWKAKGEVGASYIYKADGKLPFDWFTRILPGIKILVGANIKFDLLYALREPQNLEAWMKWVAAGGLVWDVQLAEYLLEGMRQEVQMLSLDEMAPQYGGNVKIDEVKLMWQQGINTPDIPKQLLIDYLTGREVDGRWEDGDIGNTEKIFLGQLERARACGQVKSIMLNMGSLLCTIEMERNGMAIDLELGLKLAAESERRLIEMTAELQQYLPKDLPFEFSWTNRYHLSPLIFGGQIKYTLRVFEEDENGQPVYPQKKETQYVLVDGSTMAPDEWEKRVDVPDVVRYGSGKNKGEVKTKQVTVPDKDKPAKSAMRDFYYPFKGVTKPDPKWASSTPGLYSVAGDIIESLGNRGIPFLKLLSTVAKLTKDLTTYYVSTDPKTGEKKGMLSLVQQDANGVWIIHHKINHTSTVTARFSSSDPNLQNIPKEGKSEVKLVFISRFKDGKICQSDFTSLEVYVQAILTKCKNLIEDLKLGLDMHCLRVSQTFGVTYEFVVQKAKVEKDPEWVGKRGDAKAFSFQRAYGAGAKKISEANNIPLEIVEALIKAEEERYPEIVKYFDDRAEEIKRNRIPTNIFVPHPDLKGATCQLGRSSVRTPDNKLYSYRESPSPEFLAKRGTLQSFSPTEVKNYEVQGEGGEWAKAAMWLAVRAFYGRANFGGLGLLVNQVHDALYGDFAGPVATEAAALLHACMEGSSDFMEWFFDWPIPVPVPSDTNIGDNMMEDDEDQPDLTDLAAAFRQQLRTDYMNGYIPSFLKD